MKKRRKYPEVIFLGSLVLEGELPAHHFLADKKKITAAIEIYLGLLFIWGYPLNICPILS